MSQPKADTQPIIATVTAAKKPILNTCCNNASLLTADSAGITSVTQKIRRRARNIASRRRLLLSPVILSIRRLADARLIECELVHNQWNEFLQAVLFFGSWLPGLACTVGKLPSPSRAGRALSCVTSPLAEQSPRRPSNRYRQAAPLPRR